MRKVLTILIGGSALVLGTFSEAAAQKNKTPSCGSDVGVIVTVTGTKTAANSMAYVADSENPYQNGVDRMTAIFQVDNCTHDFTLNLNQTPRSLFALLDLDHNGSGLDVIGSHFFNIDRVHSVPLTVPLTEPSDPNEPDSFEAWCDAGVVYQGSAIRMNGDGSYQDNYAPCGNDDPNQTPGRAEYNFVRRIAVLSLDGDQRLAFRAPIRNTPAIPQEACQVDPQDPACATSFVKVYHPDQNTWIIRPEPPATALRSVWSGGKKGYTPAGYYAVPFEIKVERITRLP